MSTNFGHNLFRFASIINPAALKSLSTAVDVAGGVRYLIEKNWFKVGYIDKRVISKTTSLTIPKLFRGLIQAILRPQIVPNLAFCPLKWSSYGLN